MRSAYLCNGEWIRRYATIIAVSVLLLAACNEIPVLTGAGLPPNFHTLDPGMAYRSGQFSADQLIAAVEQYGIQTVINLRGANPGEFWYDEEIEVSEALGITHVDHRMSAQSLPSPEVLAGIIETLQTAEYPILIHCQAGADRTGAISAIYRMLMLGHEREDAMAELSPCYLHFQFATPCMDKLAEIFEPDPAWLDEYAEIVDTIECTL
jgi:protein tyrosine/serine phosphatase